MSLLVLASATVAVVHSFSPDHYMPFVAIGRFRKWSVGRTLLFSTLAGVVHVSSSILLGLLLMLGIDMLGYARALERLSPLMLVLVGLGYALLSLVGGHSHARASSTAKLLLVLGLSPCLPLIPIMLSARGGELIAVTATFAIATLATIAALSYLSFNALKPPKILHGMEDTAAGVVVALAGILSYLLGNKVSRRCA